jgi:hypothetical protein
MSQLFYLSSIFASFAYAQSSNSWPDFNTNIKACTPVTRVFSALPSQSQDVVLNFCNSFVGYTTTTVTGQTDVWVTANIPLKTITVTSAPRPKYARGELSKRKEQETRPAPTRKVVPTVTKAPPRPPVPVRPPVLTKVPTPAAFKSWASLAIRTGCACLGFSTQPTFPVFTTTTATSTVPASCVRAPLSAYHISSYSPASAAAVAYEYGWFYYFEPTPDPIEMCCRDCLGRGGCVQFVYEKLDPAVDIGYARCNFLYFDDYDGQSVTGIPRQQDEKFMSCPNGYLAVNGLVKDTASTTASSATFLGPCAVSTTLLA